MPNSGRSPATAANIQAGRDHERVHLTLCCELYWHQVSLGRHFHLEQSQGSEALVQKELDDVVSGTYRTVFDMCEVGELRIPNGNNLTICEKEQWCSRPQRSFTRCWMRDTAGKITQHDPILGQAKSSGRWQNLSAFAAKYSRGFSKNVSYGLMLSKSVGELPVVF